MAKKKSTATAKVSVNTKKAPVKPNAGGSIAPLTARVSVQLKKT